MGRWNSMKLNNSSKLANGDNISTFLRINYNKFTIFLKNSNKKKFGNLIK